MTNFTFRFLMACSLLFGVSISRAQVVSDFEGIIVEPNLYWNGADGSGFINSGLARFVNDYNLAWGSWSGFALSKVTDNTTEGWGNQYSAIVGSGVNGSTTYAMVYPSANILFTNGGTNLISGVYVTNSTYAALSMRSGDAFAKKFGGASGSEPDWYKLTVEGFDSHSASTGIVEFYLADFRDSNSANDYIVTDWRWLDLQKLGWVAQLKFTLLSSDNGMWGMNTPGFFCMDDFTVATLAPQIVAQPSFIGLCPNADTAITTSATGTEPINYQWLKDDEVLENETNDTLFISRATDQSQGNYQCRITNLYGEIESQNIEVKINPVEPDYEVTGTKCADSKDGRIVINPLKDWNYILYNRFGQTISSIDGSTFAGLKSDIYILQTTTNNGCKALQNVVVTRPEPLQLGLQAQHVNCFGGNDATIEFEINGGHAPYNCRWSSELSSNLMPNTLVAGKHQIKKTDGYKINAGNYEITLTDANNCSISEAITIHQPLAPLKLNVVTATAPNCSRDKTGIVQLSAEGGTATYSFSHNGETYSETGLFDGLHDSLYYFELKDANGCADLVAVNLISPINLQADFGFSVRNGVAQFVNHSTGASTYYWDFGDGSISNEREPQHLFKGNGMHQVTLRVENNFCQKAAITGKAIVLTSNELLTSDLSFEIFPNPCNDVLNIRFAGNKIVENITITITDLHGKILLQQQNINAGNEMLQIATGALKTGLYVVEISGVNNKVRRLLSVSF